MSPDRSSMTLAYEELGRSDAEPIVFLHGLGLDRGMWRLTAEVLGDRYRCILMDLPGHGQSAGTVPVESIHASADDLARTLLSLEIDAVTLVGLSMGGAIAQEAALRHPDQIKKLALFATMAKGVAVFGDRARAAEADGMAAQIDTTLARWFRPQDIAEEIVGYTKQCLLQCDVTNWAASWRALEKHDTARRLRQITCPTLVVAGTVDASTPIDLMRPMAAEIPGAQFEMIEDGPHLFPLSHPSETSNCLEAFVTEGRRAHLA